jgi:hypothetical protein
MAADSGDSNEIINTTKQIIKNCIVDGDFNVDTAPFFDVDYLFIALRAKSVGETIDINFMCNNRTDSGQKCGNVFPVTIDICNCEVLNKNKIDPTINLSGGVIVKMKYPSYGVMKGIVDSDKAINKRIQIAAGSIEFVQNKGKTYSSKDLTKEDTIGFIEGLTQENFNKIGEFIDNFPSFIIKAKAKCNKCGFEHIIEYDDFTSFFQ